MPSFRARLLNVLLRRVVKPMWRPGLDIDTIRRHTARADARLARRAPGCPTEAIEIAGLPARWYGAPELAARNGTLLYLHGGAWCVHLPGLYQAFAATLSAATGLRVLLLDYRLAPENPFPAAVDDCLAAYRALLERAGTPPRAIAGDSAGGNLTLVTLMHARDAQLPMPDCAVLLSPSTDMTAGSPSARYNALADPMFGPGIADLVPGLYCPGQDHAQPQLSPLFGRWDGLPPLYFIASSTELLLDDSVRAYDRALQAGTAARIDVWSDVPHVFPVFRWLPEAREAVAAITAFIAGHSQPAPAVLPPPAPAESLVSSLRLDDTVPAEPAERVSF